MVSYCMNKYELIIYSWITRFLLDAYIYHVSGNIHWMVGLAGLLTGQAVDAGLRWLAKNYETQKEEDYGQGMYKAHTLF